MVIVITQVTSKEKINSRKQKEEDDDKKVIKRTHKSNAKLGLINKKMIVKKYWY